MKTIVIVLALAVSAIAEPIPVRPVHPTFAKWNRNAKIVGGTEAIPHSIPYQVGLFLNGHFCGGSLISTRWVLTAAHCGKLSNAPQVVLGAHNIRQSEPSQITLIGKKPIIHPDWDPSTLMNDISLIELPQEVSLNENIAIVQLTPADAGDFVGQNATASGWGYDHDGAGAISPVLRTVTTDVLSNDDCAQQFAHDFVIWDSILCIDGSDGKSVCNGDSGGPLTVDGIQIGLTSFGITLGCELGYPAAFTRITSFRNWIKEQTSV